MSIVKGIAMAPDQNGTSDPYGRFMFLKMFLKYGSKFLTVISIFGATVMYFMMRNTNLDEQEKKMVSLIVQKQSESQKKIEDDRLKEEEKMKIFCSQWMGADGQGCEDLVKVNEDRRLADFEKTFGEGQSQVLADDEEARGAGKEECLEKVWDETQTTGIDAEIQASKGEEEVSQAGIENSEAGKEKSETGADESVEKDEEADSEDKD
jgi:TctA family transporter